MIELKAENFNPPAGLGQFQTLALGVGVIGLAILGLSALLGGTVETALRAYLLGFCYWAGIAIGCTGILVLQHLTGGSWGLVIRRTLEAAGKTLPFMALLFIPLAWGVPYMYEWAHATNDEIIKHKQPFLNWGFWLIRAFVYFAVWSLIAWYLTKKSEEQDRTGDWNLSSAMGRFSGPAIIAFVLAVTFAAIDWVMSLDPHWYSTMFGLLFVIGWALSALSFVIALMVWMAGREPMNRVLTSAHFHDLGKLMLAFVMVWAYFNFSQFLIIYSGNLPEETPWYLKRMEGGWGYVGIILVIFHFAVPFLLLLSQDIKKQFRYLAMLAIFMLLMRLVDLFYLIAPNPTVTGSYENKMVQAGTIGWGIAAWLGVGGIWLFLFFRFLQQCPVMPYRDPFMENAIAHGKKHH